MTPQLTRVLAWLHTAPTLSHDAFSWPITLPSTQACEAATRFLTEMFHAPQHNTPVAATPNLTDTPSPSHLTPVNTPNLIAGPISSGGIGLELTWHTEGKPLLQILLHFFNDYPVEIECGVDKHFTDVPLRANNLVATVQHLAHASGYALTH